MSSRRTVARAAIATVARALAGERPSVVFVGGTVTALYPLEGGVDVRPTKDVDCVVDLSTTADYYAFVLAAARERLQGVHRRERTSLPTRLRGDPRRHRRDVGHRHRPDQPLVPRCRRRRGGVLGGTRPRRPRDHPHLLRGHEARSLSRQRPRRLPGQPRHRGHARRDRRRCTLRAQIAQEDTTVAVAVRRELVELLAHEPFVDAVPGHFEGDVEGQARADLVLDWLASLRAG